MNEREQRDPGKSGVRDWLDVKEAQRREWKKTRAQLIVGIVVIIVVFLVLVKVLG